MRGAWRVADIQAAEAGLLSGVPDGALMARAAAGLARRCAHVLSERTGGVYGRRVLILAGAGNNGGDALYAGATLAGRGVGVTAVLLDVDRVHPGGRAALLAAGGVVRPARVERQPLESITADLVIDGILGIGGKGALRDPAADLVAAAAQVRGRDGERATMVAVDVPSGIGVDSGAVAGAAVTADLTVTFGVLKTGLLIGAGAARSGVLDLVDIGLEPWLRTPPALFVPEFEDIAAWWPRPRRDDDKYTRGVVGVATGSRTYPGAAVLSVAGASAGPAGAVRYAGEASDAVRARYPAVIAADRVADAGRVQAWVCGSGLGTDRRAMGELRAVLGTHVPVCLDADAITLLVDGSMADLLRTRTAPVVLTPHDREFARLAGCDPGDDRVEAALNLAAKARAVVLLKGDHTIVATPDGRAFVNTTGTADLATAGSGDVLAGLLGSLLAAGLSAERAAVAASYAHGLAGQLAAASGPVTADLVAEALRSAVADLSPAG